MYGKSISSEREKILKIIEINTFPPDVGVIFSNVVIFPLLRFLISLPNFFVFEECLFVGYYVHYSCSYAYERNLNIFLFSG